MDKQFDDFMFEAFGKKRPIRLKRSVEADILSSFALSDELVGYLVKMGFNQREIPGLNMDLLKLHRRA